MHETMSKSYHAPDAVGLEMPFRLIVPLQSGISTLT